jgi:hypothetical protein
MAKADRKPTTETWVTLQAAQELVIEICLSASEAEPWLARQIAAKQVRKRHRAVRPASTSAAEIESFWQGSLPNIDFADNSATKLFPAPIEGTVALCPVTLLGVEVVREDIEAQRAAFPVEPAASAPAATAKLKPGDWLRIAKRTHRRRQGESKTDYAVRLIGEMEKAPVAYVWSQETMERRLRDRDEEE